MKLIRTTPAMSLLYECINGVVQGGILESTDSQEGEEIASLCAGKLRGMIASDGDPNCQFDESFKDKRSHVLTVRCSKVCSTIGIQQDRQISPTCCGDPGRFDSCLH